MMHSTLLSKEPVGIGGWLLLVGLGLVFSVFSQVRELVVTIIPLFRDGTFGVLADPVSTWYHPALAGLIVFEGVANLLIGALTVLALVLFIRTSWRFPKIYIALVLCGAIVSMADVLLVRSIAPPEFSIADADAGWQIAGPFITVMIWVPYMLVSRRVRNTFVRRGDGVGQPEPSAITATEAEEGCGRPAVGGVE